MCLSNPTPCDLEEVVAYKVMFRDRKKNTVKSALTKETYKLGEEYEAIPPPLNRVFLSESYTKGFHAYAKKEDAYMVMDNAPQSHIFHLILVKVLLKDVTFEEKETVPRDIKPWQFHTYVANKCTFLEVIDTGKPKE